MNNKFEQLLELLINEEQDKAEALFHEIVVEKSRDIYENLADSETTTEAMHDKKDKKDMKENEVAETSEESKEEAVEETTEESKDEEVKETSEESKEDEKVDEVVEIEDETTDESEKSEEESIEEVGGDATDELVKDISADEEGAKAEMDMDGDKAADDMGKDMDMDGDKDAEDMEDRVVDLEDALDELKAEFEAMMSKKDGDDEDKDEAVEMPAEETPAEMPLEGKQTEAMHKDKGMKKEAMHKDKKKMDEYKIQKSADTADHSDKGAKSPVKDAGNTLPKGGDNIAKGGADETGRPAPTAEKMKDFENSPGKDKSSSYKKQEKANTADGSDKSAKSPVASK
jgi:hypothetical protein